MKIPFPKILRRGDKGPAVAILQIILLIFGCNHAITPDGDFGEQTEIGLKRFQEDDLVIEPSGILDESMFFAVSELTGFDLGTIDLAAFQ